MPRAPGIGPQRSSFLPFLPHDNADLGVTEARDVVEITNNDLTQLLRMPPAQFWEVVKQDRSLHTCLDTYLQYKRRAFDDDGADGVLGTSMAGEQLSKRVFMVFMRMVSPCQPGTGPNTQQQADMLYNRWLMDMPKIMDICVLYGGSNHGLANQLVTRLFTLQPKYAEDVASMVPALVGNISELQERCMDLAHKALQARADASGAALVQELAEAARYYRDAALTLAAFVDVYPPAAPMLLAPGSGMLLNALAAVYEQLLPLLVRVGSRAGPMAPASLVEPRLRQSILLAAWKLLQHGFLTREGAAGRGEPGVDAQAVGQELVSMMMAISHPGQEANGAAAAAAQHQGLLHDLNDTYRLDAAVAQAMQLGLIAMDDAQFDYLLALMGGDRSHLQPTATGHSIGTLLSSRVAANTAMAAAGPSDGSSTSGGAASSSGSGSTPEAAVVSSQVTQIKELLPDFGDGYLAACLHACGYNTERVINALLEGSPPEAVAHLDKQLQHWSPAAAARTGAAGTSSKGKGPADSTAAGAMSWTGLADEAAASRAAAAAPRPPALTPAPVRPKTDVRTARVLGAVSGQLRSVTHALAEELQYDYDDEYDDSFDDLIGLKNDGVCDIEGEDDRGTRGGRSGPSAAVAAAATRAGADDEPSTSEFAAGYGSSSSRGGSGGRGPGGRGGGYDFGRGRGREALGRGRPPKQERLWVLDGKVYNYPKPGAAQVQGQEGARQAVQEAELAAQQIHGLGPGGNKPLLPQSPSGSDGEGDDGARAVQGGGRGRHGGGRDGGGGRGAGRGSYARKEQNKAAVANHHRKDRALRKTGMF